MSPVTTARSPRGRLFCDESSDDSQTSQGREGMETENATTISTIAAPHQLSPENKTASVSDCTGLDLIVRVCVCLLCSDPLHSSDL